MGLVCTTQHANEIQFTVKSINDNTIINTTTSKAEFPRTISLKNFEVDLVDKPEYLRHANSSKVRCEIRYGRDNSVFDLEKVFIDYIKAP